MGNMKSRRRNLWKKDPHCFWCGQITQLLEWEGRHPADNVATVDHVRSRFYQTRPESPNRSRGITVLACFRCNHLRGQMEQAFLAKISPEVLHEKCGNGKAVPSLLNAQAALCASLLRFLRAGGTLDGKHAAAVLSRVKILQHEYEEKDRKRRGKVSHLTYSLGQILQEALVEKS